MQLWSSSPWSSTLFPAAVVADPTVVSRAIVELLHEVPTGAVDLRRATVEVLAPVGFIAPTANGQVVRTVAEVLGAATEFLGRMGRATRVSVEVLGSAIEAHRGFQVPNLAVNAVTVALAVDLDLTEAGTLQLSDPQGYGYRLTWPAGATSIQETWTTGSGVVSTSFPAPSDTLIRTFRHVSGIGALSLTELGTLRPVERPGSGVLREVILWNRGLTGPERSYIEGYLRCKWLPSTCDSEPLTPDQQQTLEEGLVISDPNGGGGGTNPGWGDLLDDLRNDPNWLAFVDCADSEMSEDNSTPFNIPNLSGCVTGPCYQIIWPSSLAAQNIRGGSPEAVCQGAFDASSMPSWYCSGVNYTTYGCTANFPPNCGAGGSTYAHYVEVPPDPARVPATMQEFLDYARGLPVPCLAFQDTAQVIIDSPGYLGDIPDGMEPSGS